MKRLKIKDDETWAVYPVFELRIAEEGPSQLLFSLDETFLLVSTGTSDRVWDLKKKIEVFRTKRLFITGLKWANYPGNNAQVICVEPRQLHIYSWAELSRMDPSEQESFTTQESENASADNTLSTDKLEPQDLSEKVGKLIIPKTSKLLLYDVVSDPSLRPQSHGRSLYMTQCEDLTQVNCAGARHKALVGLGPEVRRVLGSTHGRLIFLDRDNWVYTSPIGWDMGSKRRLYFLPSDWVNDPASKLMVVNEKVTLLCPRYNEGVIVRYNGRL